jgi:hypothetical protein
MGANGTSPRVVIITALISAGSAIAVAYIGILPRLNERVVPPPVTSDTCSISGLITSTDNAPLKNAEVYLIRASGSENMATTDDQGRFTFQKIPDESYWVIVRDIASEKASRVLISRDESSGEIKVVQSLLRYKRCEER